MKTKERRPALASKPGVKLMTAGKYAALALPANFFGSIFWAIEQRRSRLADKIDSKGTTQ